MVKTEIIRFPNIGEEVTYYIGKSREENFEVLDMGGSSDLWFHVSGESSCHVVCIVPTGINKKQIMTLVKKGGELCKQNTAKFRGGKTSIEITYAHLANVKKTNILGCVTVSGDKRIKIT
jgi:predicted ribosome quality control (RQC) complex YloA/Tae2 family protein